jgi:predicted metal-dependent HD superfamily phosphohydrolase
MDYILPETHDKLVTLYNESHRHYHNMEHITDCFAALSRLRSIMTPHELKKSVVMEIGRMIWFHDAVYNVGPEVKHGENERKSAAIWADSTEGNALPHHEMMTVWYGIMMSAEHTKHQKPAYFTMSQQIFLDIDLCGMGGSYHSFLMNGEKIMREYAWVDEDTFYDNRIKFFEQLLKRPYIYYHHVMRGMYEEKTRNNISRWISENKDA